MYPRTAQQGTNDHQTRPRDRIWDERLAIKADGRFKIGGSGTDLGRIWDGSGGVLGKSGGVLRGRGGCIGELTSSKIVIFKNVQKN